MSAPASTTSSVRSTAWVAAQFAMMLALLVAGLLWHGQWPGNAAPAIGGALVLAGAWLGIAGVRVLGMNRTPFPEPKLGSQLITTGVYARVRHPLYASVIALGFGWALLWRNGPALALAAAQVFFFYAKARVEERLLRERFPEYSDYIRRVPLFFGWAGAIVCLLFFGLASFAQAAAPHPFDDTRLPRQVQRLDGVLVPVPTEILRAQYVSRFKLETRLASGFGDSSDDRELGSNRAPHWVGHRRGISRRRCGRCD